MTFLAGFLWHWHLGGSLCGRRFPMWHCTDPFLSQRAKKWPHEGWPCVGRLEIAQHVAAASWMENQLHMQLVGCFRICTILKDSRRNVFLFSEGVATWVEDKHYVFVCVCVFAIKEKPTVQGEWSAHTSAQLGMFHCQSSSYPFSIVNKYFAWMNVMESRTIHFWLGWDGAGAKIIIWVEGDCFSKQN